jgi:aryl-alcohol dehydrogenase-like predicted oxidoreductase
MDYRKLGRTGVKVSPLCLGTMMFGKRGNSDHEDSIRIIHRALDAGINFVDTANVYSSGESEQIAGRALKGRRDHVVLATKVHGSMGPGPNDGGNNRVHILREAENSLWRLQTDYIDLYQIRRPDPSTPIEETLRALAEQLIPMAQEIGANLARYALAWTLTNPVRIPSPQPIGGRTHDLDWHILGRITGAGYTE